MKFYLHIFVFFYFIKLSLSETDPTDSQCLSKLISKAGLSSNYQSTDYCSLGDYTIGCNGIFIDSIDIAATKLTLFNYSDYSCLKNLRFIKLENFNITQYALTQKISTDVDYIYYQEFRITNCVVPPIIQKWTALPHANTAITVGPNGFPPGQINLSNINEISFTVSNNGGVINNTYNNDLTQMTYISPSFNIISNNVPSLKNVNSASFSIQFPSQGIDFSSFSNFSTFTTIGTLGIYGPPMPFINEVTTIPDVNFISKFSTSISFTSVSNYIDFSNFKKLNDINIYLTGITNKFQINGMIPFKNLGSATTFSMSFGTITNIDNVLTLFENITTLSLTYGKSPVSIEPFFKLPKLQNLDLTSNNITGTIPDSLCYSKLSFKVGGNKLNGSIPSCFTCHFNYTTLWSSFSGNSFDNMVSNPISFPPCTSIIVNLKIDKQNNKTYIYGKDLGFQTLYFFTIPTATWILDIPSKQFYKNGVETSQYNITFKYPNKSFIIDDSGTAPNIQSVYVSPDGSLTFNGTYLTYNSSEISINVGGYQCQIISTTYFSTVCNLIGFDNDFTQIDVPTLITINSLTTNIPVSILSDFTNYYLNCSEDCNAIGKKCNRNTGTCWTCECSNHGKCLQENVCKCDTGFQGIDCSVPFVPCLNDCSNNGLCNNQTGKCLCNSNYQGSDCTVPFKQCPFDLNSNACSGHGICNNQTGICICNSFYWESDCSVNIPQHYASSVIPSSSEGGSVVFFGEFTNFHQELSITIGDGLCNVTFINSSFIECSIGAGKGIKDVTINQNSLIWYGKQFYQYIDTASIFCPNYCTSLNNGKCNKFGICECSNLYSGVDCSIKTPGGGLGNNPDEGSNSDLPISIPNVDENTGAGSIVNDDIKYDILINKLVELDISGQQVNSFNLQGEWIMDKERSNESIFIFNQFIKEVNCSITSTFETLTSNKSYSFGEIDFNLDKGSIKVSIQINNYKYKSLLNRLQVQITSTVNQVGNIKENKCNLNNNNGEINYLNDINQSNYIQYLTIYKNGKVLNARFINRVISDKKSTFITNSLVSKNESFITIGLNLPTCNECIIDPDFSVLLSSDFKSSSSCSSNKKSNYIIPIAVAIPVVCVSAALGASIFIYKRRIINKSMKNIKLRINNNL